MAVERVIGVDFGTSSSVVKVKTYMDGAPVGETVGADYIRFGNRDFVPTLVYEAQDGAVLYGYEAANAAVPGVIRFNFKLDLLSADVSAREKARKLTKMFFAYLYKVYTEQAPRLPNCDIETTIISYPAKWSFSLRDEMIEIAREAGFKNVSGLDEPTAAVKAVMVHDGNSVRLKPDETADILMVDMGAGTTDLVLCNYSASGGVSIINVWPKGDRGALLGGREIDEALCEYVKRYLVNCGLPGSRSFRDKYIDKCKAWKETNVSPVLARPDGVVRYCGFAESIVTMLGTDAEFPPLSRSSFESMLGEYLSQLPVMVNDCLDDAGVKGSDIDCVILTGGHSSWYFAEEILTGRISKYGRVQLSKVFEDATRLVRAPNPQETVALGLAYQRLPERILSDAQEEETAAVYCSVCGEKNGATTAYCAKCGSRVNAVTERLMPEYAGAAPQPVPQGGKIETFLLIPGKTAEGAARAAEDFLIRKNMNTQRIDSGDGGFIVQARDKNGRWKQFIGMDVALSVIVRQTDDRLTLEFKESKWMDKAGAAAFGLFVAFGVLAVTAGIGMYMQAKLPGEVKNAVAEYMNLGTY